MENGPHMEEDDNEMENVNHYDYEEEQRPSGAATTRMPTNLMSRVSSHNHNEIASSAQTHR